MKVIESLAQVALAPPVVPPLTPSHVQPVACGIVRCGTSRAVIVDGRTVPSGEAHDWTLWTLIAGETPADGLGGDHYQFNKIAELFPGSEPSQFEFRFYQADRRERRLIADLECANVAAGAGLYAAALGLAETNSTGVLHARNLGTGQLIELAPAHGRPAAAGDWRVRFLVDPRGPMLRLHTPDPLPLVHPDGRSLDYWVAERGNVFVLANAAPEAAEPELIEQLGSQGTWCATVAGVTPERAEAVKVILYSIESPYLSPTVARVACYFHGEQHHSIPGSAAMCLTGFLAESQCAAFGAPPAGGESHLRLVHPSGELDTRVRWAGTEGNWRIVETEFTTTVRLLLWGSAPRS
jgi:2-methylaconitate cis-trans-isomerase PrpF